MIARREATSEPFDIEFFGKIEAKKNNLLPVVRKNGNAALVYSSKARASMDSLMLQVPGEFRDMRLISPDVEFFFTVADGRSDRDNMRTSLLDCLVKMGVLRNDSMAAFNGKETAWPAVISDHYRTVVRIHPSGIQAMPRRKREKKQ